VARPGAADLSLEASRTKTDAGWRVEARVAQGTPAYDLAVPVVVYTDEGAERGVVQLSADTREAAAVVEVPTEPIRVVADPDADIFRRLAPSEVPATVNRIKGSEDLVAVLSNSLSGEARELAAWMLLSLNQRDSVMLDEATALRELGDGGGRDVFFFGMPESAALRDLIRATSAGASYLESGNLPDAKTPDTADTVFFVDKRPNGDGGKDRPITAVLALRGKAGLDEMAPAARKLTHYGTYSSLVFDDGDNLAKGIWEVRSSPMVHRFKE
jgi:hypothetical protein